MEEKCLEDLRAELGPLQVQLVHVNDDLFECKFTEKTGSCSWGAIAKGQVVQTPAGEFREKSDALATENKVVEMFGLIAREDFADVGLIVVAV